ncbi:MAG: helix-turn-helix transcriptional regulator [Clostridia bacterium]|nr:helix-turn-helix transcriptional regulator [Clostridia bacterium]
MIRLKDLREDRDLKQRELCKIINISQTNYSKYELEKINIPLDTLRKLAEFFCTSTDYILGLTDEQTPYPRIKEDKKIS